MFLKRNEILGISVLSIDVLFTPVEPILKITNLDLFLKRKTIFGFPCSSTLKNLSIQALFKTVVFDIDKPRVTSFLRNTSARVKIPF